MSMSEFWETCTEINNKKMYKFNTPIEMELVIYRDVDKTWKYYINNGEIYTTYHKNRVFYWGLIDAIQWLEEMGLDYTHAKLQLDQVINNWKSFNKELKGLQ